MHTRTQGSTDERVVSNVRDTLQSAAEHLEARACMTSMLTERQQVFNLLCVYVCVRMCVCALATCWGTALE
jgi:hypothetical protein